MALTTHVVATVVAQAIHFDLRRSHGQRVEHLDARQVLIPVQLQLLLGEATIQLLKNFISLDVDIIFGQLLLLLLLRAAYCLVLTAVGSYCVLQFSAFRCNNHINYWRFTHIKYTLRCTAQSPARHKENREQQQQQQQRQHFRFHCN